MKLRSLQIKGFKSFGNETTINFNDEIIGIVGPNGSGKSNIVDAIRWVLGEQKSKELRLEKMVDVIFNGTKSKRKAGMAMVSMTFENSKKLIPVEFDHVKISRVLYDTNESEYRINDVPCRLKDVRDLFLDTGIGSNSYAIIELGMVDDILVDKDHSRRRMFEQAAGIAKYKIRKREAQLKLKNTQNDLDRVEDILFELEASMKTLERQAKRTKRYYDLKEEFKDLSIKKAIINQAESIVKEKELKERLKSENDKLVGLTSEVRALEAEIEQIKKANLDSEQALSSKQKEFNIIVEELRTAESQKEITKQNISFLAQNIEREERNLAQDSAQINFIQATLKEKTKELEELNEKLESLNSTYQDWQQKFDQIEHERKNVQGASNEQINALKALEDQKFNIEKAIIETRSRSSNFNQNIANASDELSAYATEMAKLNQELVVHNQDLEKSKSRLEGLINKNAAQESDKSRISEQIEERKQDLSQQNRKLDALSNEHNLLKDMVDNLEGFPESAKFLSKEWKASKPLLSDVLECPDEYRGAIESFLDAYLSYFILDNVEEARHSIQLLKEAQKGRAQFFILSSFNDKVSRTQILYDHHGLPALEVVKTDSKYNELIHFLLQNVVLVEDDEVLKSDILDEDIIYLSKSGSTNRSQHSISGGSIGLFDGKRIGRKKEIEKLKDKIAKTREAISKSETKLQSLQQQLSQLFQEDYATMIFEERRTRNNLELKMAEIRTKQQSLQNNITHLENRISYYRQEDESGESEISDLQAQLNNLTEEVESKKTEVDAQSGQIETITQRYAEINASYNEAQLTLVRHQNDHKNLQNEIQFRNQQLTELTEKQEKVTKDIAQHRSDKTENENTFAQLEEKLKGIYLLKNEKQEELNETEQAFFSNRSVVNEKEDVLRQKNKGIQQMQLTINEVKDQLTGFEFELRSALERLKIEFNVDLKSLSTDDYQVEPEEVNAMFERYDWLKNRLENYGQINPMAVEAFDEIQERHTNMEEQRNDILEAKSSLEETIKEIDTDATQKFLDSFYKVKENFKEVFRSLFSSEDDCDLVLFNPENPLESDIEIVAKPKGKRPKVLNQLSGGEKTLTATALLFSLYLLKPAPFCIFDEVDAPLDDVNISKFSKLIRQFADESQFIIITHNKSTMAAMDLLYGVYMQEQGVSGVTQVDFRDYEHNEIFQNVNV